MCDTVRTYDGCQSRPMRTSREVSEARWSHTCAAGRVRSKRKKIEQKNTEKKKKIRPTQNTPRNPQQPGDRVQLETACEETRPTR